MRIPDLEYMIRDYADPLCKNCGRSADDHVLAPVYSRGKFVRHELECSDDRRLLKYLSPHLIMRTFYE